MFIAPRATTFTKPEPYVVPPSQEFDGNDGAWSTFKISVGTPGQDFRVLASTKSGETYVVVPEGCIEGVDGPKCSKLRGAERFQASQSPGFQVNASSSWSTLGQYSVDLEESLNYTAQGLFGFDEVSLGSAADKSALSLDHQVVAGIADLDYYMGYIPLGVPDSSFSSLSQSIDSFIYQLRNATKIPSLSFSYTAGAEYKSKSVFGSLVLGGYDSSRFNPNSQNFSFSFANDPSRLLTVGVESIMAINSLKGTYSLSSGAHFSLIDSTVPHLWLPQSICDNFEQAFGLTYDPRTDFYLVNSTMHRKLKSLDPSITIKLVNSLEDTSTNYTNIVLPYAAFDLQASYPYYENATNYFPIRRAANDSQYVLGRTLLQEAYLIVDYERANFSVAQATFPDPLPAANIVTIEPPSSSSLSKSAKKSLGTGAIAGIAVAGVVILLLVLIGVFFIYRKRRGSRKRKYELANTQMGSGANISSTAFKNQGPQELGGTPLTELASPCDRQFDREQKTLLDPTMVPQELPTPMTPSRGQQRWREVTTYEMDGSASPSWVASEDGTGRISSHPPSTGISPLTGRY
jgi:hypothetical protein